MGTRVIYANIEMDLHEALILIGKKSAKCVFRYRDGNREQKPGNQK